MASSPLHLCSIPSCARASFALCNCCRLHICTMHMNEHTNRHNAQLIDEINALTNRISSIELPFLVALEQWRVESQQALDFFCDQKRQFFLSNGIEELNRLRTNVEKLVRVQDSTQKHATSIKATMDWIEQDLTHVRFNFRPLTIDENLISRRSRDLLPLPPSHQVIELTDSSHSVLGGNKTHLLVHREPNLCLLDRQLTIVKEVPWAFDDISDVCWSSTLNRFILVNRKHIFTLDERAMAIEQCLSSSGAYWMRGTCSDTSLFLSTEENGSSIFEYTLMPSIAFVKAWESPMTCTKDEWIQDLKCHNGFLALIIGRSTNNESHLELRSLATFERLCSIQLEGVCSAYAIRCCPINGDQWIVVAFRNPGIFHISNDGKLVNIDKNCQSPSNICQLGNDLLAIWDQKCVNLQYLC